MATRREYLVSKGLAKPGRGKFSTAANVELAKALAEGMTFDDPTPAKPTGVSPEPKAPRPEPSTSTGIVDVPEFRYTEVAHKAFQIVDGKKITRSLREACRGCRASLVVCYCPEPTIVALDGNGSVRVYIESK